MVRTKVSIKDKDILSMNEAARFIHVDKGYLKVALESGEIPGRLIGKQWRIFKQDLIDWVRSGNQTEGQANDPSRNNTEPQKNAV